MAEDNLSPTYWNNRYKNKEVGWDIGSISTPIKEYIDQLKDKNITVLIPGCGSGYEGIYLHEKGFPNVTMLDFAQEPLDNLKRNCPSFPQNQLRQMDFFDLDEKFDLIIEQTLFCAIDPLLRPQYAKHAADLLRPNGKLVGLLFNRRFEGGPPFGGNRDEYLAQFQPYFSKIKMEDCYNSIAPRRGTELFIQLTK